MGHLQSSPALSDCFSESIVLLACFSTNNGISKVWGLLFLHMEHASETIADDAPLILHASSRVGIHVYRLPFKSHMDVKGEKWRMSAQREDGHINALSSLVEG
jgi:hypothetical protein